MAADSAAGLSELEKWRLNLGFATGTRLAGWPEAHGCSEAERDRFCRLDSTGMRELDWPGPDADAHPDDWDGADEEEAEEGA